MPTTCRATRSYREPLGPDNLCGGTVAGFGLTINRRDVERLMESDFVDDLQLFPIAYCETHLRDLEVAQADAREHGSGAEVAEIFAGSAHGVVWLDVAKVRQVR